MSDPPERTSDVVLPETVPAEGLEIRTWRVSDVPAMAEAIGESIEHLRPFMPWVAAEPLPEAERLDMVQRWEHVRLLGGDAVYGIFRDGRAVGGIGAHTANEKMRPIAADAREIGYWLRVSEEGHGTMTRAVEALTALLLATPGITHVEIRNDEANVRSAAVAQRCGYRLIGYETRSIDAPAETGRGQAWRIGPDPVAPGA